MLHKPIKHTAELLGYVSPQLATLVDGPPDAPGWIHEIKHDGYRTCLVAAGEHSRAYTRNGHDWTDNYRPIVDAAGKIDCVNAVIDGEMIVQDQAGRSDFAALRRAIEGEPHRLVFYAFDLLVLGERDLRRLPLAERRELLARLIGAHDRARPIQFSQDTTDGPGLFAAAAKLGLEGIVSKKADSPYRSGRSRAWLKSKSFDEGEFVVVGAEHEPGSPAFALLARETGDSLEYAGSAFITLGAHDRDRFWTEVERLGQPEPAIPMKGRKGRRWVRPQMRVRAQYFAGGDKLRHATIRELVS